VELFAREGAKILIADIDDAAGEELADKLGGAALYQHTDVSNREQIEVLINRAIADFGGLNIMFNNAGIACAAFLTSSMIRWRISIASSA